MRRNPDRDQNKNLGTSYYMDMIRPVEEPKIEREDLQNQFLEMQDTTAAKAVSIFLAVIVALLIVAGVIWAFRVALGL